MNDKPETLYTAEYTKTFNLTLREKMMSVFIRSDCSVKLYKHSANEYSGGCHE